MIDKLDLYDRKILYALDLDARQSYRLIAKSVGLSKEATYHRIKKLEEKGIIKGYITVVNLSRLGYMANRLMISFRNTSPKKEKELIDYFVNHPKYWWVVTSDGDTHIGIGSWEKNIFDAHKMREELLIKFKDQIGNLDQSVYTNFQIYRRAYLANLKVKETKPINYVTKENIAIDDVSIRILNLIVPNARLSTVEIAKELNLTPTIVKYRLKKLQEQKVIECFRASFDLDKLGLTWYKIEFILSDYTKKKEMLDYFSAHPNIIYAYESNAKADLEIELEVRSHEEFKNTLYEIRSKFNTAIESYKQNIWNKEYKNVFPIK